MILSNFQKHILNNNIINLKIILIIIIINIIIMSTEFNDEKKQELLMVKQTVNFILKIKKESLINNIVTLHPEGMHSRNPTSTTTNDIELFDNYIKNMFPLFCKDYPTLYKMIFSNSDKDICDILDSMINSLTDVCDGNLSLDQCKEMMGEQLASKYLYPTLGKPKSK